MFDRSRQANTNAILKKLSPANYDRDAYPLVTVKMTCNDAAATGFNLPEILMLNLKNEYVSACNTKSDINFHLPILHQYAKQCEHVTEMGSRTGVSTRAFLYANPKKFVSYDYQYATPEPHLRKGVESLINLLEECKNNGINCEYFGKNVLEIEIEETDMLFIDTYHCYEQLKKELELHASKVNKYIAFHDTKLYGEVGEGFPYMDPNHPVLKTPMDGSGGIRKAINEFLLENGEWKIIHESTDNNGLIIVGRNPEKAKKKWPRLLRQLFREDN